MFPVRATGSAQEEGLPEVGRLLGGREASRLHQMSDQEEQERLAVHDLVEPLKAVMRRYVFPGMKEVHSRGLLFAAT